MDGRTSSTKVPTQLGNARQMDRHSWLWKKKTTAKMITEQKVYATDFAGGKLASDGFVRDEEAKLKKVKHAKKLRESNAHLTGLEHQVITLEEEIQIWQDQVKNLAESLSASHLEIAAKDGIVKQHAKVAEESVSGWEKAEAESVAVRQQLESITGEKLAAEDRASHLDFALKECMMQIRLVKEEQEQLLREVILTKTKQWDAIKCDLEGQISDLDHRLVRSAAENATLSRSLQERADMLMTIKQQNSQVELENEVLRGKILDYEREINSVKYEMHVLTKEIEIRNEERSMSIKSSEAANKQHVEGLKKIVKLEAECQRLQSLVRKKLPGPAAFTQMKREVAYFDRDALEPKAQKPPIKKSRPPSVDKLQHSSNQNEFPKTRTLMVEEETKMLQEALGARNGEMKQARIQNQRRSSPRPIIEMPTEVSFSQIRNRPQSVASMSANRLDEEGYSVGSWLESVSNLSHLSSNERSEKWIKHVNTTSLELMDDFLEMERLACSPSPSSNFNMASKKNGEVAAAEEKLAHIQESTNLRGRQFEDFQAQRVIILHEFDQADTERPNSTD